MFDLNGYFKTKSVEKEFEAGDKKEDILARWSKYTEGLDESGKKTLSILLENQWIINQMSEQDWEKDFKSFSSDLVVSMYKPLIELGVCYVIPMLGPTLLYEEYFRACTRRMKYDWKFEAQPSSRATVEDIRKGNIESAKKALFNDMFSEVFEDLKTNASFVRNTYTDDYASAIEKFLEYLQQLKVPKFEPAPEWMIVNNKIAEIMTGEIFTSTLPEKVGVFKGMSVIRNPNLNEDQVLFGNRGCYVHAGYVPLTVTPTVLDPETFEPKKSFMTRYDKKLLNSKGLAFMTFHKETTEIR